ncbi:hypothetical protein MSHI_03990 [Mycobacterium shinjukuense]|uniref:Uncharacterized protein n=1 Tax=Mycobacterium shinjukuense TaxID=398694 RepID=A0A7I7MLT6_9MYCO|nr:hypothetical protein MSHI_03990 [Mycobacterium shinjukuense]
MPAAGSWGPSQDQRIGIAASVEPAQHRVVTRAFIQACCNGDLAALLEVLDPGVSGEIDARRGVVVVGAGRVGATILRHWSHPATVLVARPVCGQPAVLAFADRQLAGVLALSIEDGRITKIHVLVQPSTRHWTRYAPNSAAFGRYWRYHHESTCRT